MEMFKTVWNNSDFSVHSKIRMYKTVVRTILLYRHKSRYSKETSNWKFSIFENKALRRILGINWWHRV